MERDKTNQSIIVSGESGAGKTVSAKYAMRYFATVGGSSDETQVEKKVLASNPIMEAIGNAKTTRNDNSSRFGKYISLDFNSSYYIIGANMRTYLLEKSRVVFQAPEERNYHIFYQLCSASQEMDELKYLNLGHQDEFQFTNQGDNPDIHGVDDVEGFETTRSALTTLGFSETMQKSIFKILSALLHLGNVKVYEDEASERSYIKASDKHMSYMAKLLSIDAEQMRTWLCNRKLVSMRETVISPMKAEQASRSRDALAKHIYAQLFNWIVIHINKALESGVKSHKFIGVLDIYGFETFETNSFEQFCINYANEKLQQQFNQHVFKLEQEEYVSEKIDWTFIDFYDNQPCIDLIESKLGILDLLDEECKMPRGSDESWAGKLYEKCGTKWSQWFTKPRFAGREFIVTHFADMVTYDVRGFLEKNRDTVLEEQINILKASQNNTVIELFEEVEEYKKKLPRQRSSSSMSTKGSSAGGKSSTRQHKKTVGSQFRDSLSLLMQTLNTTDPHYVRCIKPNDEKESFTFDSIRAVQQLRACGVLETIRISAAGFPSRQTYEDFFSRYRVLIKTKSIVRNNMRQNCENIILPIIKDTDKYRFGKTKLFFRAGQVAYLEKLRSDRLIACSIMIKKHVKGWLYKNRYRKLKQSTIIFQARCRGLLARRKAQFLRETRAAIIIQKNVRRFVTKRWYCRTRRTILGIQAYARGMWGRQRYLAMLYNAKATIIQKNVRMFLAKRRYQKALRNVVIVQCSIRKFMAKKQYKKLRQEARSIDHIKKLNKGLENKVISLQQKIQELNKENVSMKNMQNEYNELRTKMDSMKSLEKNMKEASKKILQLEQQHEFINTDLNKERDEKMDLIHNLEQLQNEVKVLEKDRSELKSELDRVSQEMKDREQSLEKEILCRVEEQKQNVYAEFESEQVRYQELLRDKGRLEQHVENLQLQLRHMTETNWHQPGDDSISNASTDVIRDDNTSGFSSLQSDSGQRHPITQMQDMPLVLKLQAKLKDYEQDRNRLQEKVEKLEKERSPSQEQRRNQDLMRLQELEMENAKIKDDLHLLRKCIAEGDVKGQSKELLGQFDAMQEELVRRREECVQLRSIIASNIKGIDIESITDDPETQDYALAFKAQKEINRQLETELQSEKGYREELRAELDKLKDGNDRQQKILAKNLQKEPQSETEMALQQEMARLTNENLDLREKMDAQSDQLKRLKMQLKKRGISQPDMGAEDTREGEGMPKVKHKSNVHYMGMFEYPAGEEQQLVRALIIDLKASTALKLLRNLPAYMLFMCIRHTDYCNDDAKVRSLLTAAINGIKKVVRKKHEDLPAMTLWLSNTTRLLNILKQYSGDKQFQQDNTSTQNEQSLRNFDLSEYRQILSDIAVWIYQGIIKLMEEAVQQLVVPALLEHEAISTGLNMQNPTGMRSRAPSVSREGSMDYAVDPKQALDGLLKEMERFSRVLKQYGVEQDVANLIFKQVFYFLCSVSLNNLLLRKNMCHWSKGMQIRYNLSHLEQWGREEKFPEVAGVLSQLQPIIQAAQLLQARKTDDDVDGICTMCDKLSMAQIIKILNLYTPADEFEERVPITFIRKIQNKLKDRTTGETKNTLLMDTKYSFAVRFQFSPSHIRLEDIEVPDALNLPMLKKV